MSIAYLPVGTRLRDWRTRRRLSQMELALEADISPRHLSFVETGRAKPSREMILKLAIEAFFPANAETAALLQGEQRPKLARGAHP